MGGQGVARLRSNEETINRGKWGNINRWGSRGGVGGEQEGGGLSWVGQTWRACSLTKKQ